MSTLAAAAAPPRKPVIALLGQPNSGKSTLFNALTGSRQHVGNWPGKTVEKKEGYFTRADAEYTITDLPGTYSLSANSDEEIITRDYIAAGKADLVCILADASQLERSLFMLADYTGIKAPAIVLLNMMDVAQEQGKKVDAAKLEKRLGIPVIPFVAANRKDYDAFYKAVEKSLAKPRVIGEQNLARYYESIPDGAFQKVYALIPAEEIGQYSPVWLAAKALEGDKPVLALLEEQLAGEDFGALRRILAAYQDGCLLTGDCKFRWIGELLEGAATRPQKKSAERMGKFDRIATSRRWGKLIAVLIMLLGFVLAFIPAAPIMAVGQAIPAIFAPLIRSGFGALGAPAFITSLVCDGMLNVLMFTVQMVGFVLGISLVFGLIEEVGYMARISYVFDSVMSRLGLQGKAAMPFLVSFGCTMGGASGARVIDSWGQKVLTIALAWAVPCAATWVVVPTLAGVFFGAGAPLVIVCILVVMVLHMALTARIFGGRLVPKEERMGLIMELPPYHKPRWGNLLHAVVIRVKDLFLRALKVITFVTILFWILSYSADGNVANSIIYRIGTFIEPVTRVFGLGWQTFMAFISSAVSKEAVLGVLSALYAGGGDVMGSTLGAAEQAGNLQEVLAVSISKAEALAFIFATTFNIPCVVAIAATYQETHSAKWTARIAGYYLVTALLLCAIVFRIGLLIF